MRHRLAVSALLLGVTACGAPEPAATAAPVAAAPVAVSSDLPDPVAVVGGKNITLAELEKASAAGVIAAKIEMHQARENALQQMVVERLLEAEAAKRSMDVDGLVAAEVEGKLAPPTAAEVEAFYEKNKAQMPGPLDALRDRIVQHLTAESGNARMRAFIDELKAAAKVETFLPPFRVQPAARANAPRKGSANAKVHIVEFSDFQCGYCSGAAETVTKVLEHYGDKVSFEYRHFPLSFHDRAHRAAEAAECAGELGNFWGYHDKLFAQTAGFGEDALTTYAAELELDATKFAACLADGRHKATVDADMDAGAAVGMSGTPGFYVNGRVVSGAQPFEAFQEIIDKELSGS